MNHFATKFLARNSCINRETNPVECQHDQPDPQRSDTIPSVGHIPVICDGRCLIQNSSSEFAFGPCHCR